MYDPLIVDTFLAIYPELHKSAALAEPEKEGLSAITRGIGPKGKASSQVRLSEINASTEEMVVLYDLARALSGRISFADAADVISNHLRRMVPPSTCVLYLYDVDEDELVAGNASGEHAGHFAHVRIPRGQRLTGWVGANRMSVLNSDPVLDLGEAARSMRPPLRSCLSTPLTAGSDLVGVLTAYSTQHHGFTEDHQRVLEAVAGQVGQAIKDSLIFDRERQPVRVQNGGLPNLEQLEMFIAAELSRPTLRTGLAILHIDLRPNRAGSVNESIMPSLVAIVRSGLRGEDMLFRSGDSTMVALMTSMDRATAVDVMSRVSEQLRVSLQLGGFPNGVIGVASAPADGVTLPVLLDVARRQSSSIFPDSLPPSVH